MGNNGPGTENSPSKYAVRATHPPPLPYSHSPGGRREGRRLGGEEVGREYSSEKLPTPRSKKSLDQIFLVTLRGIFMIPETGLIVFWKMSGLVLKTGQKSQLSPVLVRAG